MTAPSRSRASRQIVVGLGTGAHTGLRRLAAGSVSHYCLAHALRPVVAVPAQPGVLAGST